MSDVLAAPGSSADEAQSDDDEVPPTTEGSAPAADEPDFMRALDEDWKQMLSKRTTQGPQDQLADSGELDSLHTHRWIDAGFT